MLYVHCTVEPGKNHPDQRPLFLKLSSQFHVSQPPIRDHPFSKTTFSENLFTVPCQSDPNQRPPLFQDHFFWNSLHSSMSISPQSETTPFLRPLFLKLSSQFHVNQPPIRDHPFSKTTFSETLSLQFHVNKPLIRDHPSCKTTLAGFSQWS